MTHVQCYEDGDFELKIDVNFEYFKPPEISVDVGMGMPETFYVVAETSNLGYKPTFCGNTPTTADMTIHVQTVRDHLPEDEPYYLLNALTHEIGHAMGFG